VSVCKKVYPVTISVRTTLVSVMPVTQEMGTLVAHRASQHWLRGARWPLGLEPLQTKSEVGAGHRAVPAGVKFKASSATLRTRFILARGSQGSGYP